jgi:diketogulonate reductase-like aldo/keto reductase
MQIWLDVRGVRVPRLLYGTAWKEDATRDLVLAALDEGFRGIDTANQRKHYHEAGVGEALRTAFAAGLGRDDLFLQTKFTFAAGQDHRLPYDPSAAVAVQVEQSFARSLEHLGVERLDAYVLHGPSGRPDLAAADHEAWAAMEQLHDAGRVGLIGVSNVTARQLEQLRQASRLPPMVVQNRCYASRGWDAEVRGLCRAHGMLYQGFSLLTANRDVWGHPEVAAAAQRLGCTPAQLILRFAVEIGMVPLTGTTDRTHMAQDLAALELELDAADVRLLLDLGGGPG